MYTNVNCIIYAAADVCFLYTKPLHLHSLIFKYFCINNDAIFHSISHFHKISGAIFSYSKRFTDKFIL